MAVPLINSNVSTNQPNFSIARKNSFANQLITILSQLFPCFNYPTYLNPIPGHLHFRTLDSLVFCTPTRDKASKIPRGSAGQIFLTG